METAIQNIESLTQKQEDFIEVETTCCLCGTPLNFTHEQTEYAETIIEKAQCPCCSISLKEKEFIIH